jgi:uncharacterized membrane protein YphA (DoxX/SURF4 family)
MTHSPHAVALRILSLAMGVFLLFMGLDKLDWFLNGGLLTQQLQEWRGNAGPVARWYLEAIALPAAPVFARVVPAAELAAGAALILGVGVRPAAALALLMVINFHIAADVMFRYEYLWNAYGPPVLGALAALAVGGRHLPFSVFKPSTPR